MHGQAIAALDHHGCLRMLSAKASALGESFRSLVAPVVLK
jgi:hypothetical protein